MAFKYERLPILCYRCGCLDHADKDCEAWIQSNGTLKLKDKRYDSSIKALPFYPSSKNTVCVPSYFETQKQKIKERATFTMKSNRRGEPDVPCRQQEKPEKEGAPSPDDFNADLNLDKPVSPPSFQSQHKAVNDDTINPIIRSARSGILICIGLANMKTLYWMTRWSPLGVIKPMLG